MSNFQEIISSETPVLVDFFATWCGPCKAMSPILTEVAKKVQGKARVLKIDVDKNQALAEKYAIRGVPTLLIFKNNKIVWRSSGVMPANQLIDKILEFK